MMNKLCRIPFALFGMLGATLLQFSASGAEPDAGQGMAKLVNAVSAYQPEGSRASLLELEKAVAASSARPEVRSALARQMAAQLSSTATVAAKQFFCWQLSIIGSGEQVPALAPLLSDTNLSYYARLALERIPGEQSLAALRKALTSTDVADQTGIISSLAAKGDPRVVSDLADIVRQGEASLAAAALTALGKIGGAEAFRALVKLEPAVAASRLPELRQAQLRCVSSLRSAGNQKDAAPFLEKLFSSGEAPAMRTAAFQLWISALKEQAAPKVLSALKGDDTVLRPAALESLKTADAALVRSAAETLGSMPPEIEVSLLAIVAERRVTGALPFVLRSLDATEPRVRLAAYSTMGAVGDVTALKPLVKRLAGADTVEQAAIANALAQLPGKDVDRLLLGALPAGTPEIQLAVVRAIRARAPAGASPVLTETAATASSVEVRREACRALAHLGDPGSCPRLVALLDKAPPQLVGELESALAEICRRAVDTGPLTRALPGVAPAVKVSLLNALAAVGGPSAFPAIEGELKASDSEVRTAALRLLADWADADPVKALVSALDGSPDARSRTLALRGLTKLAPLATGPDAIAAVKTIGQAIPGSPATEQKQLISALGQITNSASLAILVKYLSDPALGTEARATVFKLLDGIDHSERAAVTPVLDQLKSSCTNAADHAQIEWFALKFSDVENLSRGATASNPDGLKADGAGGPPSAGIDGNPTTYWDEEDNQKLYVLRVDLQRPSNVAFLRILPWQPQSHAPRDFEVVGDGKMLKKVEGAQYANTWLQVNLPPTVCRSIELRITGYYPASPAIRELEIYGKPTAE